MCNPINRFLVVLSTFFRLHRVRHIGHITRSYGRLIDTVYVVLSSRETSFHIHQFDDLLALLRKTLWVFPSAREYPFLSKLLSEELLIVRSQMFLRIYNLLWKLCPSRTKSTDDYFPFLIQYLQFGKDLDIKHLAFSHQKMLDILEEPQVEAPRPLILLYVRSSHWDLNVLKSPTLAASQQFRNFDELDFAETVKEFTDRGYLIVKIGRDCKSSLSSPAFKDYASNVLANDEMDLVLFSKARFCISTAGGAEGPSVLFSTPVLIVNFRAGVLTNSRGFQDRRRCYLPITFYYHDTGEPLTIRDITTLNLMNHDGFFDEGLLKCSGIGVRANHPTTIRLAALDFNEFLREGWSRHIQSIDGVLISTRWENFRV